MMTDIYIIKEDVVFTDYGEQKSCGTHIVTHYQNCVDHYPTSPKETITHVKGYTLNLMETVRQVETAWLTICDCPCGVDIHEGYYAYLNNKYWKIVGIRVYEECGCFEIKLTLERLEPRETRKELIECVSCFDFDAYVRCQHGRT